MAERSIARVRFELPDTHGIARSKLVPAPQVEFFLHKGLNLYGGTLGLDVQSDVVSGTGYGEEINFADCFLFPDLETLCLVPWEGQTARLICNPHFSDGKPCAAAPRFLLKNVLEEFLNLGFEVLSAHELEFYILDRVRHQPIFEGRHIFSNLRNTCSPIVDKAMEAFPAMGLELLTVNCEYAPGQIEFTHRPSQGIRAADAAYTVKNGLKELAQSLGLLATSMSKPFSESAGCGAHFHCSLIRRDDGTNAFYDGEARGGVSSTCLHFLGGLLKHLKGIMALLAPTINCYKRYRPHTFAPVNISCGFEDRTAAVRIKGRKGESIHLENRVPSGASNPYLAATATLAAGLLGIRQKIDPPPLCTGTADQCCLPPLPNDLSESLRYFQEDDGIRELLGNEFVRLFAAVKQHEIRKFSNSVTDFERQQYLEFL